MTNMVVVVDCTIHTMGRDSQTEITLVVSHSLTTLSLPCATFRALSTGSRLVSDCAKAVEESEAGRDVLEESRDVVLDRSAVLRGCEQVFTVFGEMDTCYGLGVVT